MAPRRPNPLVEVLRHYWDLGFVSFGGPGVHVVILRRRFVDRLAWVDSTTFTDLFALGNALPGPGSTQLAFSIAVAKHGPLAGLLAFLLWSLPGAAGMAALAAAVRAFPQQLPPIVLALLTGLNSASVGLIALAALQLSRAAITDPLTRILVLASASFGICYHTPWMYPTLVVSGGLITLAFDYRKAIYRILPFVPKPSTTSAAPSALEAPLNDAASKDIELKPLPTVPLAGSVTGDAVTDGKMARASSDAPAGDRSASLDAVTGDRGEASQGLRNRSEPGHHSQASTTPEASQQSENASIESRQMHLRVPGRKVAVLMGVTFVVLVVVLVVVRAKLARPPRLLSFFTNMIIAGVTIFGGGPVVIPLLRGYTVDYGWVEARDFLLGFALLQAAPGPNFNFAVYLGVLSVPSNPGLGGLLGWLGIFSPGIILKLALLPVYNSWRKFEPAKSVMRGLNAAAAGLVFTAVWQLFLVGYIYVPATGKVLPTSSSGPLTSSPFWGVVLAWSFTATEWFNLPPAFTILGGACAGLAWYGVTRA